MFSPGIKVGILGGGQLARMLALKGHELGAEIHVLSQNEDDPAAQVTGFWHKGSTDEIKHVLEFCEHVDIVTFESEFVPASVLKSLSGLQAGPEISAMNGPKAGKVFPDPQRLRQLQDRLTQKELLVENKIPTSPYVALNESAHLHDTFQLFKTGTVVKKRFGGYDGKGTFVLRKKSDIDTFLHAHNLSNHDFIAEQFIDFKRELALQVARNAQGQILFLPLVEIHQNQNRLDWLVGPARHPGLPALQKNYVGLIAFELFDRGPELLVNEIAPRVHNSGHASLEALSVDQFTLHLLAILNQPFPVVEFHSKFFAMTNLLGQGSSTVDFGPSLSGHLHWYGKIKNSPGRKMGHISYLGSQAAVLVKKALLERKRMKL
jgi:5-(carboxyamino)imidazole ribonucleotide synthase